MGGLGESPVPAGSAAPPCPLRKHPRPRRRCGTAGSNVKPRPDIDIRTESYLNASERLQTPYEWLTSPKCRDQVRLFLLLSSFWFPAGRQRHAAAVCHTLTCLYSHLLPALPRPAPCPPQFKAYMTSIVTRRNTITGTLYRDDPVIMSCRRSSWGGCAAPAVCGCSGRATHPLAPLVCPLPFLLAPPEGGMFNEPRCKASRNGSTGAAAWPQGPRGAAPAP